MIEPLICYEIVGDVDINISDIKVDSRKVEQGDLFICLSGFTNDGHDYANQAVEKGAVALICEKALDVKIPQVIVKNSHDAMTYLADVFLSNLHIN